MRSLSFPQNMRKQVKKQVKCVQTALAENELPQIPQIPQANQANHGLRHETKGCFGIYRTPFSNKPTYLIYANHPISITISCFCWWNPTQKVPGKLYCQEKNEFCDGFLATIYLLSKSRHNSPPRSAMRRLRDAH